MLVAEARGFLTKLVGPAVEEAGLLLQDEVRLLRFRNQLRIVHRAKQILLQAGREPTAVPFRTLAPILEGAALEHDPGLSEKWACLLANAGGQTNSGTHPAFPRILAEITPSEAYFIDELSKAGGKAHWPDFRKMIMEHFQVSEEDVNRDHGNLFRLGVCGIISEKATGRMVLRIGPFGALFVRACSLPDKPNKAPEPTP